MISNDIHSVYLAMTDLALLHFAKDIQYAVATLANRSMRLM